MADKILLVTLTFYIYHTLMYFGCGGNVNLFKKPFIFNDNLYKCLHDNLML